ncbi:MAG: antibiotic biosynthesis monooxygenase [Bacteroidetes bacterium]|nr:antibiotic biosynthesis monooxygenase [Bacteroidota bacterium]
MIKRIVKMTFRPDAVQTFLDDVFEPSKSRIRAFPGCRHMELLRHTEHPHVLCTFSIWDSEEALNEYRHSELFKDTWAKTKALFAQRAEAWSMETIDPHV